MWLDYHETTFNHFILSSAPEQNRPGTRRKALLFTFYVILPFLGLVFPKRTRYGPLYVNVIKKCNIMRKLQYFDIRMTYTIAISGDFWTYYNPGMITKHAENESQRVVLDIFWISYYSFSHQICVWYKRGKLVILCTKLNSKEPHIGGSSMLFVCDYDIPWEVC